MAAMGFRFFKKMKIREIVNALERFAPLPLQDDYDNSGLQTGFTEAEATGALLCLDIDENVIQEAIDLGYNLIISHHPLIFYPLKSITGKNHIEKSLIKAIRNDITLYSAHTNLDNAPFGVSYNMASILGLNNIEVLSPKKEALLKLVVYVPDSFVDKVREALFASGCGSIGNYDQCSFNSKGTGTFRPGNNSDPFIGKIGESASINETRIETIIPLHLKHKALKALLAAHPYQEPAYDFIMLENSWKQAGSGVIGELPLALSETDFLNKIKHQFKADVIKHNALRGQSIAKIAVCGGSGAFLIDKALKSGADAFVTGEIGYHRFFGYDRSMLLIEMGHYESEQFVVELLENILQNSFPKFPIRKSKVKTNPAKYYF